MEGEYSNLALILQKAIKNIEKSQADNLKHFMTTTNQLRYLKQVI